MWADGSSRDASAGRQSTSSEVAIINEQLSPATLPLPGPTPDMPIIGSLNFTNSNKAHIGNKYITVNNAVHVDEVVQGRCLGLEVISSLGSRRLRCGVVVFVCWALVVASGLLIYFFCTAFTTKYRIDIGLNETWYLRRLDWQAMPPSSSYEMKFLKLPAKVAMIGHSATSFCSERRMCITHVRSIQKDHLERYGDIGPNFLIGGEQGLVFEGAGSNVVGSATAGDNFGQISIMFIGDYTVDFPTQSQLDHLNTLLAVLVDGRVLHENYTLYGYYVSCCEWLCHVVKNSSLAERLACGIALALLALCAALTIYFTVFFVNETDDNSDIAPSEWYIKREKWLASPYNHTEIEPQFDPLRLVVIQHTAGNQCKRFVQCAAELRNLQSYFFEKDSDIPYNFVIGNDGRVYEGRGWNKLGAHTKFYNRCTVGIGFMGDYRDNMAQVTDLQQKRVHMLLAEGAKLGFVHPEYKVVAALDVRDTQSPGANLYNAMQSWEHYDHKHSFKNKTCEEINDMPFPQ